MESWLGRHALATVAVILVLSIAPRVIYFAQLRDGPCLQQHRWAETDMNAFDTWARGISSGDWLSRSIPYPLHDWHRRIADDHFLAHPEDRRSAVARNRSGGEPDEAVRRLWDRWCGGGRFYQDPLYPYLIALTYTVFGASVQWVFVWQMVLGVLTNLLLYAVGRRYFSETAGALSALFGTLYAPLLFYEIVLLRASLITFASLALAHILGKALDGERGLPWLVAGFALGLCLWLKSSFLLVVLGAAALLVLRYRGQWRRSGRLAASLAVGIAIGFAPAMARNLVVGVSPFGTASAGGLNFIVSNARDAFAGSTFFDVDHTARIMDETGGRLLPSAVAAIQTHRSTGNYLRLLSKKLAAAWDPYEIPNNANFYYYRLHATALHWLPVTFLIVGPLGLVGLFLATPAALRAGPLYVLVASHLVVLVFFVPLSRFRTPMAVTLIPFAALTIERAARWVAGRRILPALVVIAGVGIASTWTGHPLREARGMIRVSDHEAAYLAYYNPEARAAESAGDWDRAARIWADSLRFEPELVRRADRSRPPRHAKAPALLNLFARAHDRYANALRMSGRPEQAAGEELRARELREASRGVDRAPRDTR